MSQLPEGCKTLEGEVTFNVGECPPDPCTVSDDEQDGTACVTENKYCCTPKSYSRVELMCDDGEINFVFAVSSLKHFVMQYLSSNNYL